jgi:4'-phosphopantetheinyl transferase
MSARLGGLGWPDPPEVDVWKLRLDAPPSALARLEGLISPDERARADRFAVPVHRCRFVAAHGLLRCLLGAYLDAPPARLAIQTGPEGKPSLGRGEDLRFNLSHSGDLGLVAVAWGREVGIDVEAVRPLDDLEGLVSRCLSDSERAAYAELPEPARLSAFYQAWVRKEAFLKALGTGLSRPLDSFDVTLRPGDPPRVVRVGGEPSLAGRYTLHALSPAPGFAGALAVEGTEAGLRLRGWVTPEAVEEIDGSRGQGRHGDVRRGGQPRGAVRALARGQGDAEGMAFRRQERVEGGLPGVRQERVDRHDPGEPAPAGRGHQLRMSGPMAGGGAPGDEAVEERRV